MKLSRQELGSVGQQRMVAEHAGVVVGGTVLVGAVDLADGGVQVVVMGRSPGRRRLPTRR